MPDMNGIWRRKTSSKVIDPQVATAVAVLTLLSIGALLAFSRIGGGLHLHMPGHQGLFRIVIMMVAARAFGLPWGATMIAAGASAVDWYLPAHALDPVTPIGYFLCGIVIDLGFRLAPQWRGNAIYLATVGAVANASKPFTLWLAAAAGGIQFDWLHNGLAYPFFSHLAFGIGAGLAAAGLIRVLTRRR